MSKRYLTRQEAAIYLSQDGLPVTKNTLQKFATVGGGPEYAIFGNRALQSGLFSRETNVRKLLRSAWLLQL